MKRSTIYSSRGEHGKKFTNRVCDISWDTAFKAYDLYEADSFPQTE